MSKNGKRPLIIFILTKKRIKIIKSQNHTSNVSVEENMHKEGFKAKNENDRINDGIGFVGLLIYIDVISICYYF